MSLIITLFLIDYVGTSNPQHLYEIGTIPHHTFLCLSICFKVSPIKFQAFDSRSNLTYLNYLHNPQTPIWWVSGGTNVYIYTTSVSYRTVRYVRVRCGCHHAARSRQINLQIKYEGTSRSKSSIDNRKLSSRRT
jgi:hypothetical protein